MSSFSSSYEQVFFLKNGHLLTFREQNGHTIAFL